VEADGDALAELRRAPGSPGPVRLPANFHRHSDGQTVASLESVFRAIRSGGLGDGSLDDWGVVAAPRHLGRMEVARVLTRFATEGPGSSSPFAVTHNSLHSVAGTISVALRLKGLSIGAGGGNGHLAEGLLTALTFLDERHVGGLWVVFSEWAPEPVLDADGRNTLPSVCRAVALALLARPGAGPGLRLRVNEPDTGSSPSAVGLADLAQFLQRRGGRDSTGPVALVRLRLPSPDGGPVVELAEGLDD
jgi:hypothetical protein